MSRKQETRHSHGPSNINLGIFICCIDVCQPLFSLYLLGVELVKEIPIVPPFQIFHASYRQE